MSKYSLPALHPDLAPYFQGDDLCHPLIQVEGLISCLFGRVNIAYAYKLQQVANPEVFNEWATYLPHLSVIERQIQFLTNEVGRQDPEYFRIIGQIWTDPEILGCTSSFMELVLDLPPFTVDRVLSKNTVYLMTDAEQQKLANLPDELTVYRGHHPRLLNGISWTLDRNIALQYAIGFGETRFISTGVVSKSSIIAFIDRWAEDEILVPTQSVRNIATQAACA
jgi:hypothetical protein